MDDAAAAERRRRRRTHGLTLAFWLLSAWLLLTPVPPGAEVLTRGGGDKLAHVGLFLLLAATLHRSLRLQGGRPRLVLTLVVTTFYGLLTEAAQARTGYRSFELADFLADVLGASLFVGLAGFFGWLRRPP